MKKKISAEVVAHSRNEQGQEIASVVVTLPRIVLAELNTHRMFSRNSASSRAIPFKKMLDMVNKDPFIPIAWQKDHSGMQGTEYITDPVDIGGCIDTWLKARDEAVFNAGLLAGEDGDTPVTKQLCNRLLEPFMWHKVLITATEFENFFALRCPQYTFHEGEGENKVFRSRKDVIQYYGSDHKVNITEGRTATFSELTNLEWLHFNKGGAEIHIAAAAEAIWDALNESTPKDLKAGEYHIPFGDKIDYKRCASLPYESGAGTTTDEFVEYLKIKIATARCARVSYNDFEGQDDYEKDIKLHDRLASMGHWSPFEHIASAMPEGGLLEEARDSHNNYPEVYNEWSGNLQGFVQYRKTFDKENIVK